MVPPRDVIADALRVRIMSGELKPGERLREDAVAEEYGVSRVPVREALRRLESEGFVSLTPYRGATVSQTSRQDSLELMQVRRALETMAARLAAQNRGGPVAGDLLGDVLRHVAFWNQYVADTARGKKADDSTNELPKSQCASKSKVLESLTKSTADAAAALREHSAGLDPEKAGLAESFIEHVCEHYGQLVIYARWAGVVPPASRG